MLTLSPKGWSWKLGTSSSATQSIEYCKFYLFYTPGINYLYKVNNYNYNL